MGTLNEDLSAIKEVEDKIVKNKVARFAYTDKAYTSNDANGVAEYNVNNDQNIPTADASVLKVNETVLSKGYRAQASSVTRMLLNHFFGRMSYNLNKVNDIVSNLIATLIGHRGTANGFATLDENGKVPYSQLPESAMEYKGQWNAETNTPTLADGTGAKGDFYIVSVSGTQNLGSGNIQFFVNDRIIYDGSVWSRLSAGDVKTVNSVLPTNGNVALTGENIPVSSTDSTLLSAPLTTDRYADSSVTTEKIADNAVTNAKIKDPISVAKGGTGATDAKNGFTSLANGLTQADNPRDEEYMIYKSGGNWGLYTLGQFWEYLKTKISSVLGLTATQYNGNATTATKAGFLDEYPGAGGTRLTSGNIVPKDASECGGMRKDIVSSAMTDSGNPGCGGHLITMFWDNQARYDSQLFIANDDGIPIALKVRQKQLNEGDYGPWVDIITSNNIGSQTVAKAYSGMVHTCYTDSATAAKTVSIPGFTLTSGACIRVKFLYGNKAKFPTLNVNNTGAHQILGSRGSLQILIESASDISVQSGLGVCSWDTGIVLDLYYDGANWVVIGDPIVKKFYDGTNALHKNVSLIGNVNASILW